MPNECTQAEWNILDILWNQGSMTTGQITRGLQPEPGWTQHAVCTLLKRMKQKDLIVLEETGGMERYVCKLPKEQVSIAPWALDRSLLERLKGRLAKGGKHQ